MGEYEPLSYGYYPPNILDDPGRPVREGYSIIRARLKVPWKPEGTSGRSGLVSMPLIIPPVKEKNYEMFGELFAHLWNEAQNALEAAEHIIIIGYSFPRTDHRSNKLFLDAFSKRKTVPRVSIVNPSPEQVRDKFLYEFGIPSDYLSVYREYFSEQFAIDSVFRIS